MTLGRYGNLLSRGALVFGCLVCISVLTSPANAQERERTRRDARAVERRGAEFRGDSVRQPVDLATEPERRPVPTARPDAPARREARVPVDRSRTVVRPREDVSPTPADPPAGSNQPRVTQQDDTPRRTPNAGPVRRAPDVTDDPQRNQPIARPDSRIRRTPRQPDPTAPVARPDGQTPPVRRDLDRSRPVVRDREDVARSIARPPTSTGRTSRPDLQTTAPIRRTPGATGDAQRSQPITRPNTDFSRGPGNTDRTRPIVRSRDDVPRSIARPSGNSTNRSRPGVTPLPDLGRRSGIDRSQPISRPRNDASRSVSRTPAGTDRSAIRRDSSREAPDIARMARGLPRGDSARTVSRGARSAERPVIRASAVRSDGTIRTTAFRDSRTIAHGRVNGRDVYVRTTRTVRSRDVTVINAGHFDYRGSRYYRGHRWPYGDYWRHGHFHPHHYHVSASFTFVHSYYAPAHVVVYDVAPVVPVVYDPPVFSLSFAYVSRPVVVCPSVRYVQPVYFAPPTVLVYRTIYVAPVVAPVVFTPIVPAPVVVEPVPVVAPVVAPVYYYYPAYYYPVVAAMPTYVVEPAPVVAAPAVVEAPSSSWSISTAFSFLSRSGKSFDIGASFTRVKSEPAVVVAPTAVAAPGVAAAEQAPAGDAAPAEDSEPAPAEQVTVEAGLTAIRSGDMEQARSILSQVVAYDPENGMARMLYAAALVADGQYTEAADAVRRSFDTWRDLHLRDFYLPAVYDNSNTFTQTVRDVREFLSDHPERPDAWLLVAWTYAFSGQTAEAASLLSEAGKSWPDDQGFVTLDRLIQANDAEEATAAAPTK